MRLSPIAVSVATSLALFLGAPLAHATPVTTDTSDLWYNPNESGWGVGVHQQGDTIFLEIYAYNNASQPVWFVGSNVVFAGTDQNGVLVFAGPLYQTSGPYFGGTFNPNSVTVRQVGTVTFNLTNLTTATINYSVDGVAVTKSLVRQLWAINNMTGSYQGGQVGTNSNCGGAGIEGYVEEAGTYAINHTDNGVTMTYSGVNNTCTYSGQYAQAGKMGLVTGSFQCTNGTVGNFQAFGIETQITGLQGRLTYTSNRCVYSGRFGGLRRGS